MQKFQPEEGFEPPTSAVIDCCINHSTTGLVNASRDGDRFGVRWSGVRRVRKGWVGFFLGGGGKVSGISVVCKKRGNVMGSELCKTTY